MKDMSLFSLTTTVASTIFHSGPFIRENNTLTRDSMSNQNMEHCRYIPPPHPNLVPEVANH